MNPILREALKATDGKMTPGLMNAVNNKRDEIMDRVAAVKGTTRQALEAKAKAIARQAIDQYDGTSRDDLLDVAEDLWDTPENSGVNWCNVEAEIDHLRG